MIDENLVKEAIKSQPRSISFVLNSSAIDTTIQPQRVKTPTGSSKVIDFQLKVDQVKESSAEKSRSAREAAPKGSGILKVKNAVVKAVMNSTKQKEKPQV